jgi:L-aspartate oxidase
MRAIDPARFPNVVQALREAGHDPATQPVPVAPASHYVMGGIVTDLDGRSSVAGLYAVGECACTGLHGANRLASNSLSECFVFGHRAAFAALDEAGPGPDVLEPTEAIAGPPSRETRNTTWERAGLERDAAGLAPLLRDPHPLARLVARCAIAREETRGAHSRTDFPSTDADLDGRHTVLAASREEPRFVFWP